MSQIGGQFGFFLGLYLILLHPTVYLIITGLSIITMIQIIISGITTIATFIYSQTSRFLSLRKRAIVPIDEH